MKSMEEATEEFIREADYLTPADQAAVTALRNIAVSLDEKMNAALVGNWYKIYSDLKEREVQEPVEDKDEQEQLLEELGL